MKLHLGCGNDYREGYVNCDMSKNVKTDRIVDIEKPLPFEDNSVNEIVANHVFEHVYKFVPLMHEIYRVCDKNALIKIKTPFYSSWGQFNDPTHVRFFTPFTFGYFNKGNYSHEVGADRDMFEVRKVVINFGVGPSSRLNWLINPIINFNHVIFCRLFAWIVPAAEIEYELRVLK